MIRRLLVLVLLVVSAGFGARAAYACSCVPRPSLDDAVKDAQVAFSGEVLRDLGDGSYEVRVEKLLKGKLPPVVTVRADSPNSPCGRELPEGPIVYAAGRDLHALLCTPVWTGDSAVAVMVSTSLPTSTPSGTPSAEPSESATPPPAAAASGGGDSDSGFPLWPVPLAVGALAWAAYALRKGRKPLEVLPPEPSGNAG